ncbi:protein of unknown function [Shewanella oneidensis MR-1]|uniref:Uncharacterized protein n=1 Tax=Shewanella oneidensis (strain ATCC 700550 / JCM 31522 / CIP 106686 / LMG 19005 / NCIMB 14063 / MR-1) TaxID=211586 RepID=Q8EFD0_SHEON|nr:protein of unknown function [Shewanella oneidensis MR-1]
MTKQLKKLAEYAYWFKLGTTRKGDVWIKPALPSLGNRHSER